MSDSYASQTITLPSGGTVEIIDIDELTHGDVHRLRATIKQEDTSGETTNALMVACMEIGILEWNIPYFDDQRPPRKNRDAYKRLKARDGQAIETALEPFLELMKPVKASVDDTTPGSPTQPASE